MSHCGWQRGMLRGVVLLFVSVALCSLSGQGVAAGTSFSANELVSIKPGLEDFNGYEPALSWDGRYVAFLDRSAEKLWVRDRRLGTSEFANPGFVDGPAPGAGVNNIQLSDDGRFVSFDHDDWHEQLNPLPLDPDAQQELMGAHVYVRDLENDTLEILGTFGADPKVCASDSPAISADGRYVAFSSRDNGTFEDPRQSSPCYWGGGEAVFRTDRQTGTSVRIDVSFTGGPPEVDLGDCCRGQVEDMSGDGRYVLFYSSARNLVLGDTNDLGDLFLRDLLAGTTERVNVSSEEEQESLTPAGCLPCLHNAQVSDDGRYVVFPSGSPLAPGDNNENVRRLPS